MPIGIDVPAGILAQGGAAFAGRRLCAPLAFVLWLDRNF